MNNLLLEPTGLLAIGGALLAGIAVATIAVYVYMAIVLMTIGKKLNHPYPWLAWIPFANIAMVLQMGNFHWAWVFLILVPFIGALAISILALIASWRIFEKRGYHGALCLVVLLGFVPIIGIIAGIANLVIWGMVAWVDK